MVSVAGNILTPALNKQLVALQGTARSIDTAQAQLASGKRVNSALDSPKNFFTAFSLKSDASQFSRLLDGISQSIRAIQQTDNGLRALDDLVRSAETRANELQTEILGLQEKRGSVSDIILADNPDMYLRLNDLSGTTAINSGTGGNALRGLISGGVGLDAGNLYFTDDASATSLFFDGVNDRVNLRSRPELNTDPAGYPEKTIELFFNAEDVSGGKQVLYEQGNISRGVSIYVESGRAYVSVTDDSGGGIGPFNISGAVKSGETNHIAFTLDAPNSTFTGYLNGEIIGTETINQPLARYNGAGAIGRNQNGGTFHDGPNGGTGEAFRGRISDVASYNQVISEEGIQARFEASLLKESSEAQAEVQKLLEPVNPLLEDTSYLGTNLLLSGQITTNFNASGSSNLVTKGAEFSLSGAGIDNLDFSKPSSLTRDVNKISSFRDDIRTFSSSLASDLNTIETRQSFTESQINNFNKGSDDLTLADTNEVASELLALQTRQAIQVNTLALAAQSVNIGQLLLADPQGQSSSNTLF